MSHLYEQAAEHVLALDAHSRSFTFQTFDDDEERKAKSLARIIHAPLERAWDTLVALNERRAGIFVMVNEGDGKGRSRANVTRIRSVFTDHDGTPLPRRAALPLRPHFGVSTSPGHWHVYWLVQDVPIEAFPTIQAFLARRYGTDPKVKDTSRVMRLAGFYHRKGTPYLVRLHGAYGTSPYTLKQLTSAWPALRDELKPKPADTSTTRVATTSSAYAEAALTGEWQDVKNARPPAPDRPGERNDVLNRAAFNLGTLVGAGIITEDEARNTLTDAVKRQQTPLSDAEASGTITRGLAAGKRNPRSVE